MKEQLAKLIEAYAAARCSQNATLLEFAASQLNAFMMSVEITESRKDDTP
jgi:hypothetical protein